MHRFRVWAPNAARVMVEVAGVQHALEKRDGGWWQADVAAAQPGMDYAWFLDDADLALPDPRSPWQPQGVHGPSRIFDRSAFAWSDGGLGGAAPGQRDYLRAARGHVHAGRHLRCRQIESSMQLRELGVTHVELMPVNAFPGVQGWGYDGVDLFAPHQPYGGPEALQRLVDACHARGLAVLLDVVYNHLGPAGNYLGKFGPYFTAAHHTPWGEAVNLEGRGSRRGSPILLR